MLSVGSGSPNQTTPGRSRPLHLGHLGKSSGVSSGMGLFASDISTSFVSPDCFAADVCALAPWSDWIASSPVLSVDDGAGNESFCGMARAGTMGSVKSLPRE